MAILSSIPFCDLMPELPILGENTEEIKLSSADENSAAMLSLASQSRLEINIFTQNFEDRIYNNVDFETALFELAKLHRSTRIRILIKDSSLAVKKGHRILKLAQKVSSSISIKNPVKKHFDEKSDFITVDRVGMVYRPRSERQNYKACLNYMSPQRIATLDDFFNEAWGQAELDRQVRRLYV